MYQTGTISYSKVKVLYNLFDIVKKFEIVTGKKTCYKLIKICPIGFQRWISWVDRFEISITLKQVICFDTSFMMYSKRFINHCTYNNLCATVICSCFQKWQHSVCFIKHFTDISFSWLNPTLFTYPLF